MCNENKAYRHTKNRKQHYLAVKQCKGMRKFQELSVEAPVPFSETQQSSKCCNIPLLVTGYLASMNKRCQSNKLVTKILGLCLLGGSANLSQGCLACICFSVYCMTPFGGIKVVKEPRWSSSSTSAAARLTILTKNVPLSHINKYTATISNVEHSWTAFFYDL